MRRGCVTGSAAREKMMKKQRNTAQKKIIMHALACADHPTATELYERVHGENPRISKATVFRVLSQFAENGEILRLHIKDSDERYDTTLMPHGHLRCVCCGRVADVMSPAITALLGAQSLCGMEVYSAEVNFSGLCPDCAAAKNAEGEAARA